jgi:hypothetical protein
VYVAFVLKEVKMPPCLFYRVMHWQALQPALGAGKSAAAPEIHVYMKFACR